MFNNKDHGVDLYGEEVEVDYRGYEVTVEAFLRTLTGEGSPPPPKIKIKIEYARAREPGSVELSSEGLRSSQDVAHALWIFASLGHPGWPLL